MQIRFNMGFIALTLICANAFAYSTTKERATRILADPVLASAMQGVESKYHVTCSLPKEQEIEWRCLNGPQCGYKLKIACSGPSSEIALTVQGMDSGIVNDIEFIEIKHGQL